jgi:hypothetical protein
VAATWGTTASERMLPFPCDSLVKNAEASLYRGVTVQAPPARVYRWLCQLKAAPYSYDWIDNVGRRSPQHLLAGLEKLEIGQDVMGIFKLVGYEEGRQITLQVKPDTAAHRAFGDLAGTYLVLPRNPGACRLLVKLIVRYPPGWVGLLMSRFLPWGDLVMMRRQLRNIKRLAERSPPL